MEQIKINKTIKAKGLVDLWQCKVATFMNDQEHDEWVATQCLCFLYMFGLLTEGGAAFLAECIKREKSSVKK